ncbi:hypothetical protein KP509_08G037400 [Ceratopteris richardii]|uniref:Uncharacterized protein n=1 Tax=Ceratopteris richardii TaxID=49495 RepID=A0A8T2U785_CERRI|nr:hypothetical protein KP509_08G037400 [Ceratopteris richardii]
MNHIYASLQLCIHANRKAISCHLIPLALADSYAHCVELLPLKFSIDCFVCLRAHMCPYPVRIYGPCYFAFMRCVVSASPKATFQELILMKTDNTHMQTTNLRIFCSLKG